MKLNIMFVIFTFFGSLAYSQKDYKIDTIYYDNHWKGVPDKAFASYYRVVLIPQSNTQKMFKSYYKTGELQGEGNYIHIDSSDDRNSIFEGECISYYKSGKPAKIGNYNNGKRNGEYIAYYENGLVKVSAGFVNDKLDGTYIEFSEDNVCKKIKYKNGIASESYYTLINQDGLSSKYDFEDKPVYSTPDQRNMKSSVDGWFYYDENGIRVAVKPTSGNHYGNQYRFWVTVQNFSLEKMEFDPDITKVSIRKSKSSIDLKVYSAVDYIKKIQTKQYWMKELLGVSQGLSAAMAGNITTTVNTDMSIGGYTMNSKSVIKTYDSMASFQAHVMAGQEMKYYSNKFEEQNVKSYENYLKPTVLEPGQSVEGYFVSKYREGRKGDVLDLTFSINGIPYNFSWPF